MRRFGLPLVRHLGSSMSALSLWFPAKNVIVQGSVIFPRVHVPCNKGGIDGQPEHLRSMFVEEPAQTETRIKTTQFGAIAKVDKDRMSALSLEFWLDELCAAAPFLLQQSDHFRMNCRMIHRRNQDGARHRRQCFDAEFNRSA